MLNQMKVENWLVHLQFTFWETDQLKFWDLLKTEKKHEATARTKITWFFFYQDFFFKKKKIDRLITKTTWSAMPDREIKETKEEKTTHPRDIYMQYLFPLLEVDFYSFFQKYPYPSFAKDSGHYK